MSEKLTVAELLARSGRTPKDAADRPRRRRRSLEQGGVSVAELTGNIPVVKDEHLDAEDAEKVKPEEERKAEESERQEAARKAEADKKAEAEKKAAAEKRAEEERRLKAEREKAEREEVERRKAEDQRKQPLTKVATGATAAGGAATPVGKRDEADTRQDIVVEKWSTAANAAQPGTSTKAPRPAAGAAAGTAGVAGAGAATAGATKLTDKPTAKTVDVKTKDKGSAETREPVASEEKKRSGKSDKSNNAVALSDNEELRKLQEGLGEHEVLEYEDDRISWPAMIVQALLAVALGVGIFFGFSLLWDRMGTGIVLILALAVTLFLVGIVHAILRHKDKWILVLALVVGLVLTVGPRLILGM
ncbi:hypothetical protein [uncultured Corynebacterium sp.]|uniref:hypothetical protein n=1 Tax=uncultured Corynebacterium sp. TaxID=159447 RepID=UPI0025DD606F|nr:hypothetical protein [uncultured Corynebacterium sp.]